MAAEERAVQRTLEYLRFRFPGLKMDLSFINRNCGLDSSRAGSDCAITRALLGAHTEV